MSKKPVNAAESIKIPKLILLTSKFLETFFPFLAIRFAAKLFTTPIKHKAPKRELQMDLNSKQLKLFISSINKTIHLYFYGSSSRKVLLVHGWSGRGTQLVKIADALLENGFEVISFDAPAHGKSSGNSSIMTEFIASILEIDSKYGPFDFAIGHSLGGMALLNSMKQGFKTKKLVTIGAGDLIQDIIYDFISKLNMKPHFGTQLKNYFEKKYNTKMNEYSAHKGAEFCDIPTLVIHDKQDNDVPVKCAHQLIKHLKKGTILLTQNLGHRKILGDKQVIHSIIKFLG